MRKLHENAGPSIWCANSEAVPVNIIPFKMDSFLSSYKKENPIARSKGNADEKSANIMPNQLFSFLLFPFFMGN